MNLSENYWNATEPVSVYVWGHDWAIFLLGIIAFCQCVQLGLRLYTMTRRNKQ
jgi:hypothetical protein